MAPLSSPQRLFRVLALAEVVTWTLLLAGMAGKYLLDLGQWGVRIGGGLHGFVFLAYCLVALLIAVDRPWRPAQLLLGWVSAVVPYATVPFERYVERQGLLAEHWRLRSAPGRGPVEQVTATALRRPLPAAVLALVLLGLVFGALLAAGPPTQWFA